MQVLCLKMFLSQRLPEVWDPSEQGQGRHHAPTPPQSPRRDRESQFQVELFGPKSLHDHLKCFIGRTQGSSLCHSTDPAPRLILVIKQGRKRPGGWGTYRDSSQGTPLVPEAQLGVCGPSLLLLPQLCAWTWVISVKALSPPRKSPLRALFKEWRAVMLLLLLTNWTLITKGRD